MCSIYEQLNQKSEASHMSQVPFVLFISNYLFIYLFI